MILRRPLAFLMALGMLTALPPADAEPYPTPTPLQGYTLRASSDEIRIFANPNMKANIVGYIVPGDAQSVHVLEVNGDWCLIAFTSANGAIYGYVPLSCFDIAATASPAPTPTISYLAGKPAWIVNQAEGFRLNLREEPSHTARSLGKYYTGAPMILTGQADHGFVKVLLAGTTTGWVDERYLTTDASSFVPELPTLNVQSSTGTILRAGPGTHYELLARIGYGTPITVLGIRDDGWYHVQVDDLVGYVTETVLSGRFSFDHGMDSDQPVDSNQITANETVHYINTRSSGGMLNLRKSASSSSKSLGKFYTGTPVTILSYTRTGWAYVRIGQSEGYLDADYLTTIQPTQYGVTYIIRNKRATGLNLRSAPSTGSEIITFVDNFNQVTVLGELSDGWCFVQYGNIQGYMLGSSLESTH